MFDQHGLRLEDVKRMDRQNWASTQRLCRVKARASLWELRVATDTHRERTLGMEMYLQVCTDYIDIFLIRDIEFEENNSPSF